MLLPPFPLFAAALLLSAAPIPDRQEPPRGAVYTVTCTFTNPAYTGPCGVDEEVDAKLGPRAACGRILACLNDAMCTKTYCNATSVRGGWKLVSSARKAPSR